MTRWAVRKASVRARRLPKRRQDRPWGLAQIVGASLLMPADIRAPAIDPERSRKGRIGLGSKPDQPIALRCCTWFKLGDGGAWTMAGEFWFDDRQWAAVEPLLPKNQPGARRVDDRRVLSGIVHVLRSGGRWKDCPAVYGPPTTVYNRFHRWSRRGLWQRLLRALVVAEPGEAHLIDSTTAKVHRSAAGAKGGPRRRRSAARGAAVRPNSTSLPMARVGRSPSP